MFRPITLLLGLLLVCRAVQAQDESPKVPPKKPADEKIEAKEPAPESVPDDATDETPAAKEPQEAPSPEATPAEASAEESPAEDPLEKILAALDQPVAGMAKIAVIRIEGTGTAEDLSGLEEKIENHLASMKHLTVIPAEQVFEKVGPEFPVSEEGIAGVAKKVEADAALFPRVFRTEKDYELHLWLVSATGEALLDRVLAVPSLPPGKAPPEARAPLAGRTPTGPMRPPPTVPSAEETDAQAEAVEAYHRRALAIALRQRFSGAGASIGFSTGHVAVGVHSAPVITTDWMIVEGASPIGEARLAELAGRDDIRKRIEKDIGVMQTYRNVGIGMTLGGFIAAGIASPFFKQGSDEGITGAGVAVGIGTAVGVSGLVLWLIYGPQAASAQGPYPTHHLVTQEEAEAMVESHNATLRRELGLSDPSADASPSKEAPAVYFSVFPDPGGGAAAILGFEF